MMEKEVFEVIGIIITFAATGAGSAFLMIKFWGEKWVENKFTKDLELFKFQKLHDFDLLLNRKTKWHEKEHEVLSQSWKKLVVAHRSLRRAISLLKQFPNIEEMSDKEREKFFLGTDLTEEEIGYIENEKKRGFNLAYSRVLDNRSLHDAHKAFNEFDLYFETNKIFLRPHIKEKFEKASDYIWSAWVSKKMDNDENDYRKEDFGLKAYETENEKIKPLVAEIEDVIQKELFLEEGGEAKDRVK